MADEPIGNDTLKRLLELFDSEDATRFSPKVARLRSAIFTTTCAACGRPLDDTLHRCEQCGTRYCSAECEQGNSGHSEFCETTALAGNPIKLWIKPLLEKHERLAIAACGATSDARCYICLEGGDLVRGCACRGNSGFVHLNDRLSSEIKDEICSKLASALRALKSRISRICGINELERRVSLT